MPELKRLFVGAKMDKDSDERFVANGDYTDGVNIEIISSEGGDSGVVRNKKGNTLKSNKTYNASTEEYTQWTFGFTNAVEVGIFKHTPTNTIYTFINTTEADIIMEYNEDTNLVSPILVDANNILQFDPTKKITGIAFLEGVLGWVQDDQEPKAIVLEDFRAGSVDFLTHTQYESRGFIETDITMIRLAPLSALSMELNRSLRDGIISTQTQVNLTQAQIGNSSLSEPIAVGNYAQFNLPSSSAYRIGDKVKLTTQAPDTDPNADQYEVNMVLISVTVGGSVILGQVISASTLIEDTRATWDIDLIESKPLFELLFPRFSYRWKYKNNQYSTYAPFTQVAFLPDEFLYNSQKGFNLGMTNNVRKITLSDFATPPLDVDKIEILYKESNSTAVYAVEEIDADEVEYEVVDELIHKLISSNQLLRPWDACPRSATALEVVANRFVIGNYKQNYDVPEALEFDSASVNSTQVAVIKEPEASVKSLRTYQAGVIYKDLLGRETPIFSSKTGIVKTTLEDAATKNVLAFRAVGEAPEWATHFKYFIKDISNEYYNLAADRLYKSEDNLATWISFPSSERNKVSVDSYLIAKKIHDSDAAVDDTDNKFKIIDIQSEAPSEISTTKEEVVNSTIWFDSNFGDGNGQTTKNAGSTPIPNSKVFLIASDQTASSAGISSILLDELKAGSWIRFSNATSFSKFYKVASISKSKDSTTFFGVGERSEVHAKVNVTEPFGQDVNFLYTDPSSSTSPLANTRVTMTVHEEQDLANQEQFTGRFFIKLASNTVLNNVFKKDVEYITLNAATCFETGNGDPYPNGDINFGIYGGGKYPYSGYTVDTKSGGLDASGEQQPSWARTDGVHPEYDIVFEKRHRTPLDTSLIAAISTIGTQIKFSNHNTVYTIKEQREQTFTSDKTYTRYWTKLDKKLTASVSPYVTGLDVTVEIVGEADVSAFTSTNPAIFETEPLEGVDLNLYHEASDAFPISEYNDLKTLDYFNCYAFGNGVESNRIRDDFNAVYIDKGPKVSTVLDKPYAEEDVKGGMIWSGIFNSNSGVNNSNQFIAAETITKKVSPIYGSIQYLHARDTDVVICCEDKILQALADKDALYNADGSSNITASNAVIGDVRPFIGEFGMSKDPASFASYGFRAYFTDKDRGVVIRLSRDGITPIVKGYEDELETNLKTATDIMGSFDDETGKYNLLLNGKIHQYSEDSRGWTSTWEINPGVAITLNNVYYTTKDGQLWAHDDETNRNSWYGNDAVKSSITFVFNDEPSMRKRFKTLNYEGDDGWIAPSIETDVQSGRVLTWEDRENKYYNYIRGLATTWNDTSQSGSLDPKEFSVQGIGNLISIAGDTAPSEFTINIYDDPADHGEVLIDIFGITFDETFN